MPPTFDWTGSKNVKSAEVLYPMPHRFADAAGTAIGYDDEVVFPVKITPENAGEPVTLSLTFEYGLCKDLCIPSSVDLRALLPADLGKGDALLIEQANAVVFLSLRMDVVDEEGVPFQVGGRFLAYLPWLLKEVFVANVAVAKVILDPIVTEPSSGMPMPSGRGFWCLTCML